jgi:hypothetical protein
MVAWVKIATLLFRLNLAANHIEQALENVREAFRAAGVDVEEPTTTLPTRAEQVETIIDNIALHNSEEAISHQDDIAIAIAKLCLKAGATIYSYSATHSTQYFDHAAQLILSSPATRKHTAAAYTYTLQAISSANMLQVDLSRSWLRLANKVKGSHGTSDFSAVEAVVVSLDFLNCATIGHMNYEGAYKACIADNNMDTLVYAGGLDLAGSFLAGRDLRYTLLTGEKVLEWLQYDLQPASKVMIASSIQLAANCSDSDREFPELQGESLLSMGPDIQLTDFSNSQSWKASICRATTPRSSVTFHLCLRSFIGRILWPVESFSMLPRRSCVVELPRCINISMAEQVQ